MKLALATFLAILVLLPFPAQGQSSDEEPPRRLDTIWAEAHVGFLRSFGYGRMLWRMDGRGIGDTTGAIITNPGNKIESTVDFSSAGEMGLYLSRT